MSLKIISLYLGLCLVCSSSLFGMTSSLPGTPANKVMSPLANERFNPKPQDKTKQTTGTGTALYQGAQGGNSSLYQGNQNSSSIFGGSGTSAGKPVITPVKSTTGTVTK